MMGVKLGTEEIKYINLFENMTGASVKDCILQEKVFFVVKQGQMGLAIGRKGANIQRLTETIGKPIEIIEYSDDPETFVRNILRPASIRNVTITTRPDNKVVAILDVLRRDKGLAIGPKGKNIERAKTLMERHHNIGDIVIM
jgi:N utilization substance protein A